MQAYYAMFHAAKALVLKKGYREKSHVCLQIALEELYVKESMFPKELVDNFELCKHLRHEADYGLTAQQENAKIAIHHAKLFIDAAMLLL
ncbi:MAG: HEPN domain-containing protein [Candidatus Thermoplasmatota archaeon]|nr:HEPN domain-containing protein [Candidatus Thermoplasmatota archaeon]MBU1940324.1 HEPN domain-containing protein [Candidatus Thermoplasmatota archaeon]